MRVDGTDDLVIAGNTEIDSPGTGRRNVDVDKACVHIVIDHAYCKGCAGDGQIAVSLDRHQDVAPVPAAHTVVGCVSKCVYDNRLPSEIITGDVQTGVPSPYVTILQVTPSASLRILIWWVDDD